MSRLTGTSAVPSGTTILASTPSSTASYSIVALSVSISARMSPVLTLSPSRLSHLARLPFSMVGDSAGIRILIGIGSPWFAPGRRLAARLRGLAARRPGLGLRFGFGFGFGLAAAGHYRRA